MQVDLQGGRFVHLELPEYPQSLKDSSQPFILLDDAPSSFYISESGLSSDRIPEDVTYRASQTQYRLEPNQNELSVPLEWTGPDGISITKTLHFNRSNYAVGVTYQIRNPTPTPLDARFYAQLRQRPPASEGHWLFSLHTFSGASISTTEDPYQQFSFSKLDKQNINLSSQGGWLAMQQRYFLSAWIPAASETYQYFSQTDKTDGVYAVGLLGPQFATPSHGQTTFKSTFYAGPELAEPLKALAPHLDLTIDFGWLWPISIGIFWIMSHIHDGIGNWGWSIVLVTLLIKLAFYKLSEASYRSMGKMRNLTPKLQAIRERYAGDQQKIGQATMELYRQEKVNPLGGCLPMIVQIPFFIALYYVLIESVQLRQAPFIFWIKDLSIADPYFILPILMGISMLLQQKLNPPPADPMQAKIMLLMPVVFTVFFATFPAGLVLYWFVNNCTSILQQWHVMRKQNTQS